MILYDYRIIPNSNLVVLVSPSGRHLTVSREVFTSIVSENASDDILAYLEKGNFKFDDIQDFINNTIPLQGRYSLPDQVILKLTNVCNYACKYCQASSGIKNTGQVMSWDTAKKAVDLSLSLGKPHIEFEFQGGEPLTQYDLIKKIVQYSESKKGDIDVHYRCMSNLSLLTDEMIDFFDEYNISLGTSLDGPEHIHNYNRPASDGKNSYQATKDGLDKLRKKWPNRFVNYLVTYTKYSLEHADEVIDYNLNNKSGFHSRGLFKLGRCYDQWDKLGYSGEEFCSFWDKGYNKCIEQYKTGDISAVDLRTTTFVLKIVLGVTNDIEMNSPCGALGSMISIDWDGTIVTCEGAKMQTEKDDYEKYALVNINDVDDLKIELYKSRTLNIVKNSFSQNDPSCAQCAYKYWCSNCMVERERNFEYETFSCKINKHIIDTILLDLLDPNKSWVLKDWAVIERLKKGIPVSRYYCSDFLYDLLDDLPLDKRLVLDVNKYPIDKRYSLEDANVQ